MNVKGRVIVYWDLRFRAGDIRFDVGFRRFCSWFMGMFGLGIWTMGLIRGLGLSVVLYGLGSLQVLGVGFFIGACMEPCKGSIKALQ